MSGTSFAQRALDFTFTRADGVFTQGGKNTVTLSGLRASITVTLVGLPGLNSMTAKIFGLTSSFMNDLSTLGLLVGQNKHNTVSVYAGDTESGLGLIFKGELIDAWANFESMPEVSFDISAQTGMAASITPISPSSYRSADIVTIISGIAQSMGRAFENNGVGGRVLQNPYLPGTATQQLEEAAYQAGIDCHDDGQTVSIWPKDGAREGVVPVISPQTGLVGYPKYTANGLDVVTIYNPSIKFGTKVQLESSLKQATGIWRVYGLVHNLEAQTAGGSWFSAVRLVSPAFFAAHL